MKALVKGRGEEGQNIDSRMQRLCNHRNCEMLGKSKEEEEGRSSSYGQNAEILTMERLCGHRDCEILDKKQGGSRVAMARMERL